MLLRTVLASVLLAGCYSPELADCVVTCGGDGDCAGDQNCVGGLCTGGTAACGDAGNGMTMDAPPGRKITLRASVMGEGKIVIANVGECKMGDSAAMCTWSIPTGTYSFEAISNRADKPFERWSSILCSSQDATCTAMLFLDSTIAAKFK